MSNSNYTTQPLLPLDLLEYINEVNEYNRNMKEYMKNYLSIGTPPIGREMIFNNGPYGPWSLHVTKDKYMIPLHEVKNMSIQEKMMHFILCIIDIKCFTNSMSSTDEQKSYITNILNDLEFNIESSCDLGGLAHLLILYNNIHSPIYNYICNLGNCASALEAEINVHTIINGLEYFFKEKLDPNLTDQKLGYTFFQALLFNKNFFNSIIPSEDASMELDKKRITNYKNRLKVLISNYQFDVNTKDKLGNSIIHTAIISPYFYGDIVSLIEILGEKFDIDIKNKDGKNILEYLEECLEKYNVLANSDISKLFREEIDIDKKIKSLTSQKDRIKLKFNPLIKDKNIETIFLNKFDFLNKQGEINLRMATFLGEPILATEFDAATITINELNDLIKSELAITHSLANRVISLTKKEFGIYYKIICKFIMLGMDNITIGENQTKFSIEQMGMIFNSKIPYPSNGTIIEKINWLHEIMIEKYKKTREITSARLKALTRD